MDLGGAQSNSNGSGKPTNHLGEDTGHLMEDDCRIERRYETSCVWLEAGVVVVSF